MLEGGEMVEELKVSTPEEYMSLTQKKIRVSSGGVFHIKAMGAASMVFLIPLIPEAGLTDRDELLKFVEEHFVELVPRVIQPNVIAPKMDDDAISFMDVVDLFVELTQMSMGAEEESFPDE